MRRGTGRPLLLVHGLGGSWRSWDTVLDALAAEREVVAVDLPGFGATPPLPHPPTIAALTDALEAFMDEHGLRGADVAGSSMGARLALELARRGAAGATVALDPGGFWSRRELRAFHVSIGLSIRLLRALTPALPLLMGNPVTRTLLLAQFSSRPWRLPAAVALQELRGYASAPSFDPALHELVHGPTQEGRPVERVTIGWGTRDLVTLPRQAHRATARFPGARLVWFEGSGHFPQWDVPDEAARAILAAVR